MSEREETVPDAVIDEILREINGELSDEELTLVREKLLAKDQYRRFQQSIAVTAQLLQEGPALVRGTPAERESDWRRCTQWVEELWASAADLWRGQSLRGGRGDLDLDDRRGRQVGR